MPSDPDLMEFATAFVEVLPVPTASPANSEE